MRVRPEQSAVGVLVACLALAATLMAQRSPLEGTWAGTGHSPVSEPMPVTLQFIADGPSLRGYWLTEDGNKVPLQDLEVEGETVSFWFSAGEYDMIATGIAGGKEMKLTLTLDVIGITFDAVLTRK